MAKRKKADEASAKASRHEVTLQRGPAFGFIGADGVGRTVRRTAVETLSDEDLARAKAQMKALGRDPETLVTKVLELDAEDADDGSDDGSAEDEGA